MNKEQIIVEAVLIAAGINLLGSGILENAISDAVSYDLSVVNGGPRYVISYPNGYGASIIKSLTSCGHEDDLWEIAVLMDGRRCYDTGITSDVLGWLTDEEVEDICRDIALL